MFNELKIFIVPTVLLIFHKQAKWRIIAEKKVENGRSSIPERFKNYSFGRNVQFEAFAANFDETSNTLKFIYRISIQHKIKI